MTLITSMALAAVAALVAGATVAQIGLPDGASTARLAVPVSQPTEKLIDGRDWSCVRDLCAAGHQDTADSQPLWLECTDAAAEFGAFIEYRTGPETLDPAKLSRCNAHAKAAPRG